MSWIFFAFSIFFTLLFCTVAPWHLLFHFHSVTPPCSASSSPPPPVFTLLSQAFTAQRLLEVHRNPLKVAQLHPNPHFRPRKCTSCFLNVSFNNFSLTFTSCWKASGWIKPFSAKWNYKRHSLSVKSGTMLATLMMTTMMTVVTELLNKGCNDNNTMIMMRVVTIPMIMMVTKRMMMMRTVIMTIMLMIMIMMIMMMMMGLFVQWPWRGQSSLTYHPSAKLLRCSFTMQYSTQYIHDSIQ